MNLGAVIHLNKTGFCVVSGLGLLIFFYLFSNRTTIDGIQNVNQVIDLRKLLSVAIKAAQNGGSEVVSIAGKTSLKIESKGKTKEGLNDTVTTADFKSHCAMKSTLAHHFPNVLVISEEAKTKCDDATSNYDFEQLDQDLPTSWISANDVTIWIDPLDATKEYTEKLYKYVTTMVCVAIKGVPTIGVIYKPFTQQTSWAWVGHGRSSDLVVENLTTHPKLRFIISRSHSGNVKALIENKFEKQDPQIITAAGAGFKVLELVSGSADVYVHTTAIKKWDTCAGHAILNTVGGQMTTLKKVPIYYDAATSPVNEDGLIATIKNHDLIVKAWNQ